MLGFKRHGCSREYQERHRLGQSSAVPRVDAWPTRHPALHRRSPDWATVGLPCWDAQAKERPGQAPLAPGRWLIGMQAAGSGTTAIAGVPMSTGDARESRAAHLPACREGDTPISAQPVRSAAGLSSMACRIAAGRTWSRLEALLQEHLFSELGPCRVVDSAPRPGLFAWSTPDACHVFVVTEMWTRRGVPYVDVAPLSKHGEGGAMIARMRSVMTRRVSALHDVCFFFRPNVSLVVRLSV